MQTEKANALGYSPFESNVFAECETPTSVVQNSVRVVQCEPRYARGYRCRKRELRIPALIASMSLITIAIAATPKSTGHEARYAAGLHRIMQEMDAGMTMAPRESEDRQFMIMMIPHHQAAIRMAQLQLRYGHDERLTRLSQEIIVEQQQEIEIMRSVLERKP